jgi:hypothetical protein
MTSKKGGDLMFGGQGTEHMAGLGPAPGDSAARAHIAVLERLKQHATCEVCGKARSTSVVNNFAIGKSAAVCPRCKTRLAPVSSPERRRATAEIRAKLDWHEKFLRR